jgi:hypothetical protein
VCHIQYVQGEDADCPFIEEKRIDVHSFMGLLALARGAFGESAWKSRSHERARDMEQDLDSNICVLQE